MQQHFDKLPFAVTARWYERW